MSAFQADDPMRDLRRRDAGAADWWAVARGLALGLSLAIACQSALAQAMYRIKPLGHLGGCISPPTVFAFNDADQVTGRACNANGDVHAFLWKNNGKPMVDLGPAEKGSTSAGYGINASGLVVGSGQDSTGEFGFVSYGNGAPMTKIPNGFGGGAVAAYAVNDSGQVTGAAETPPPYDSVRDAFLWKGDGSAMINLGAANIMGWSYAAGVAINASGQVAGNTYDERASSPFVWKNDGSPAFGLDRWGGYADACCINASGQVAGTSATDGGWYRDHAYLWKNDGSPQQDLGTLGGWLSRALALNDSGQVVGWSYTRRNLNAHAFVWMNNGQPMKDLGTFGGTVSQANDVNNSGQVTGWANLTGNSATHAFLWRNNGTKIQDLNALIDPTDPLKPYVTLTSGSLINKQGDIVAEGTDSRTGESSPYLLQGTVLTLSPRSLAFANQRVNTTSAAKTVTVRNTSNKPAAVTSITLSGSGAGQFSSTNNCGSSLAGNATCTISVRFRPTSKGAKAASLSVNGGGGGLRVVKLTGTGV